MIDRILNALRAAGKDPDNLAANDLAPADAYHLRGRRATAELAEFAGVERGMHVVDIGAGVGGAARLLAERTGCVVTGIDGDHEYVVAAQVLSRMTALGGLTRFCCADATRLPFGDGVFDLAWTQHVQMSVQDKAAFYGEAHRVLKQGGRLAFHDILAGRAGHVRYPTPWAGEASHSHLVAPEVLRSLLERTGFRVTLWLDTTDVDCRWHLANLRKRRAAVLPLGVHLLMGSDAEERLMNLGRNLEEGRITVYMGVAERD